MKTFQNKFYYISTLFPCGEGYIFYKLGGQLVKKVTNQKLESLAKKVSKLYETV